MTTEHEKLLNVTKEMGIVIYPDSALTTKCHPIDNFDDWVDLAITMKRACNATQGLGLSACQLGKPVQLAILSVQGEAPITFWNPTIIPFGNTKRLREGCLCMPGVFGEVVRYRSVIIKAETPAGPIERKYSGKAAHALQHEWDHMQGEMFFHSMKLKDRERILEQHERLNCSKEKAAKE